jgi:hypothetical protein
MPKPNQPFVLLHHKLSDKEHWDLCLDLGELLATWQVLGDPTKPDKTNHHWPARRIADHRRAYLEYEGPISGGRGEVTRVDRGTWRPIEQGPITWLIQLEGASLKGTYRLPAGLEPGEMRQIPSEEAADSEDRPA